MKKSLIRQLKRLVSPASRIVEGHLGVRLLGHRGYVGGLWDEVGELQFDYLVAAGLQPTHCLLDIGCGSLRGGVRFIQYLGTGNYLGLDKERELVDLGIQEELGPALMSEKQPTFVISDRFEFDRFDRRPDYSLAQSLFTHLTAEAIALCLTNLRAVVVPGHRFFATFFEGSADGNPTQSLSLGRFEYERDFLEGLANQCGWIAKYHGDWNHPRDQLMMEFLAR